MFEDKSVWPLIPKDCQGLLTRGGTVSHHQQRQSFRRSVPGRTRADLAVENFNRLGLDGLVVIGGDGTQAIGYRLMTEYGIPVVGVPKTIDNDLEATEFTFGFWSSVDVATDALDRLHTTAESHDRLMVLEVMGRTAGWIALYSGVAGGADCIVIPRSHDPKVLAQKILERRKRGDICQHQCAEGAKPSPEISVPDESKGAGETPVL